MYMNCHRVGNIQHTPHSCIDHMAHTLPQPIAILILVNISFNLPVTSETSPTLAGQRRKATAVNCVSLALVLLLIGCNLNSQIKLGQAYFTMGGNQLFLLHGHGEIEIRHI